jgi:hypothetical protein
MYPACFIMTLHLPDLVQYWNKMWFSALKLPSAEDNLRGHLIRTHTMHIQTHIGQLIYFNFKHIRIIQQ